MENKMNMCTRGNYRRYTQTHVTSLMHAHAVVYMFSQFQVKRSYF